VHPTISANAPCVSPCAALYSLILRPIISSPSDTHGPA
jgi:hypothetical protein